MLTRYGSVSPSLCRYQRSADALRHAGESRIAAQRIERRLDAGEDQAVAAAIGGALLGAFDRRRPAEEFQGCRASGEESWGPFRFKSGENAQRRGNSAAGLPSIPPYRGVSRGYRKCFLRGYDACHGRRVDVDRTTS